MGWVAALSGGVLLNYAQAQALLPELTPPEVERRWRAEGCLRLGSGLYVAKVERPGSSALFVVNGFYGSMRHKYAREGSRIHWMVVEFNADSLSWAEFRGGVIGATDPCKATPGSIRSKLLVDRDAGSVAPVEQTV